jgi:hypothetical protein
MFRTLKTVSEYKRFNSYAEIANFIETPEIQRNIIPKQIEAMKLYVSSCLEKGMEPVFGTIDLVKVSSYPKMYISDGQHRLLVIEDFYKNNTHLPIHVMIHNVETYEEMEDIFRIRNLGVPLPDFLTIKAKGDISKKQTLIKELATWLEQIPTFRYRNANRPYVNITTFLDFFLKSKLFNIIENKDEFEKVLNLINSESYQYVLSLDDKGKRKLGITANMMNVWTDSNVYIGYNTNYPYFSPEYDISRFETLLGK